MTTNALYPGLGFFQSDLLKFEASASRLESRNDLGDVIGDKAEADITMILFDNFFKEILTSSECELSCIGHHVSLIQDDQLQLTIVARSGRPYLVRDFVSANFLISSRTTAIPLSSLALSSITICL